MGEIVVACVGLGALTLKGIEDTDMSPARGQIALVRNEPDVMMGVSGGEGGEGFGYSMTRAAGRYHPLKKAKHMTGQG